MQMERFPAGASQFIRPQAVVADAVEALRERSHEEQEPVGDAEHVAMAKGGGAEHVWTATCFSLLSMLVPKTKAG